MLQAETIPGGVVIGPPHNADGSPGGGVRFTLDTGRNLEEEGQEINIPLELRTSKQIFTFTGSNADILEQILKLAGLSLSDHVTHVRAGDVVICVRSAWDPAVRTYTGTIDEILHKVNTSNGCKPIIKPEIIAKDGGSIPELNSKGGYDYSGEEEKIADKVGLVTLPKLVTGTNCGNCIFNQNGFCDNGKVLLPVTSKMCCSYWDDKSFRSHIQNIWKANFFTDRSKEFPLNDRGGYDYSGEGLNRAREADLITLPPGIEGTNCSAGNCMYRKEGMCIHPKINLPVTDHMSCSWWDNTEVIREWGAPVEIQFGEGGPVPANWKKKDWQAETSFSPRWKKKKESLKQLSTNSHKLRLKVNKDLESPDERTFLTALAVAIMDRTAERVGNDDSADNGHFGVTGFRKDHISVVGKKIHLNYVGKAGTKHDKSVSDLRLANALRKAIKKAPGKFVFETSDSFRIKSDKVTRYLEPFNISPKALRGYNANKWIIELLKKEDGRSQLVSDNPKKARKVRKQIFNKAVKETADRVGHGAATLKKHYMIPELPIEYIENGKIIDMKNIGYYQDGGPLGDIPIHKHFSNKNEIPDIVNKATEKIYLEAEDEGLDKFFNSKMVKEVDWKDVVPTQDFLRTSKFNRLENVEDIYSIDLPWAIEYNGKYYVNDGHHRAVAMHNRKQPIKMHVYTIENDIMKDGSEIINQYSKTNNMKKLNYPTERLVVTPQSIEERELQLFIGNDNDLYRQRVVPIQTNLVTKIAKDVFDINKAPLIYKYLIDDGIKKYNKEFGGGMQLTKTEKQNLANTYVNEFLDEAQYGNYENYLPKKYQMAGGGVVPFEKTIYLGKVDYEGRGRKINSVDIHIEIRNKPTAIDWETLKPVNNVPELSMSGNIWNSKHSDIVSGGQNLDEIQKLFPDNKELKRLIDIWRKYHLNDLHAGTKKQSEALEKWKKEKQIKSYDYDLAVAHLKSIGLYEDKGYKYGNGWLYQPLPESVITEIKELSADKKMDLGGPTIEEISNDLEDNLQEEGINDNTEKEYEKQVALYPNVENDETERPVKECLCFSSYLEKEKPELIERLLSEDVNSNPELRAQIDEAHMAWGGGKM